MRKHFNKIICIGWQKTGTTTLETMLTILGYRVGKYDYGFSSIIKKGEFSKLFAFGKYWDALSDLPWFKLYKELDNEFPGSKFILTIRDPESWEKSVLNHYKGRSVFLGEWLYGSKNINEVEVDLISSYMAHNNEIIDYFKSRPNDLLVLDWSEDGWKELCNFLAREQPKYRFSNHHVPLPMLNTASDRKKRENRLYHKYIKWNKIKLRLFLIQNISPSIIFFSNYLNLLKKSLERSIIKLKYRSKRVERAS